LGASNIFFKENSNVLFCFIQAPGAPYTIIKCNELKNKGIKQFIILGMSAAIGEKYDFGDIFLVKKSLIGEGTSQNYIDENIDTVNSSEILNNKLADFMKKNEIDFKDGFAWTTDCPLRETIEEINILYKTGVNCIDMECSALFSFGNHFEDIECSALFITSDIFCKNIWNPGFSKKIVIEKILQIAELLSIESF
jgi:uridine phosphorylase